MEKCLVLFVEGETEVEFYKKLLEHLHSDHYGGFGTRIEYKNVKGVGGFKSNALRKFRNEVQRKYGKTCEYTVAFCHDTDVFEFSEKPPVNWDALRKEFKALGVKKTIQVKAVKSIEDWFLYDSESIKKFLGLSKKEKINGNSGYEKLKNLFKKADRIYFKGTRCDGFVERLNMEVIIEHIQSEINPLIDFLFYGK